MKKAALWVVGTVLSVVTGAAYANEGKTFKKFEEKTTITTVVGMDSRTCGSAVEHSR